MADSILGPGVRCGRWQALATSSSCDTRSLEMASRKLWGSGAQGTGWVTLFGVLVMWMHGAVCGAHCFVVLLQVVGSPDWCIHVEVERGPSAAE